MQQASEPAVTAAAVACYVESQSKRLLLDRYTGPIRPSTITTMAPALAEVHSLPLDRGVRKRGGFGDPRDTRGY